MESSPLRTNCKISNIYIINEHPSLEFGNSDIIVGDPDKSLLFSGEARRLNIEKLRLVVQIIYFKSSIAYRIANRIFECFANQMQNTQAELTPEALSLCVKRERFFEILRSELETDESINNRERLKDFDLALDILERKRIIIILIGGTSGCGKSTVASFLASRFGISTVLSTDTIRHILRNFLQAEDYPVLFASTYEAGTKLKITEETKDLSPKKRTLKGYLEQARLVQERLLPVIASFQNRNESIVVEGVHITPDFMARVMAKFQNCLPFVISISNESKHKERFAIRSKHMTLEKNLNKYVANFANIRHIHKHLVKKADEYLIPKIDNTNVDKSIGIIHKTILRSLRKISIDGQSLYSKESKKAHLLHELFNEVTKNVWSSKAVKEYFGAKVNKNALMSNFLKTAANNDNLELDLEEKELSILNHPKTQNLAKSGVLNESQDSLQMNHPNLPAKPHMQKSLSDDQLNKNFVIADDNIEEIEGMVLKDKGLGEPKDFVSSPYSHVHIPIKKGAKHADFNQSVEFQELAVHRLGKREVPSTATKEASRKLNLIDLEDYIEKYNFISIPTRLTRSYQKNIMRIIKKFNATHQGQKLKLKQTQQKYIICKITLPQPSYFADAGAINLKQKEQIENLKITKKKTRPEEKRQRTKIIEGCNYSQENSMAYSDQDSAIYGEEEKCLDYLSDRSGGKRSLKSGSLEVNVHGKSFKAPSGRVLELSDDSGPEIVKDELTSPDEYAYPDEIDSANSISEEDEEEDSDEERLACLMCLGVNDPMIH